MSDDAASHTLLNNTVWSSLVKHLLWDRERDREKETKTREETDEERRRERLKGLRSQF